MTTHSPVPIVIPHVDLVTENATLRQRLTQAEAVIVELRGVVAELRKQIDSQQAHIHRLVKMTFGRGGERIEGPTLFDATAPAEPPTPDSTPPTKRKGHGRRSKPKDLRRRREEIDLSDAEKVCPCCGTAKIRIGQSTSERLDYQPMAIFVRELVRPTYTIRTQPHTRPIRRCPGSIRSGNGRQCVRGDRQCIQWNHMANLQ